MARLNCAGRNTYPLSKGKPVRRTWGRLSVTVAVVLGAFAAPLPATAWEPNGCKYGGTNPTISYWLKSVGTDWTTAVQVGQAAWDAESVPGYFTQVYGTPRNIEITDANYAFGAPGQHYGLCQGGVWMQNLSFIELDTSYLAGYTAYKEKVVAIHELGHAYGLAHETYTNCTIPSVMVYSLAFICAPFTPPWLDDVNGVNAIY